MCKGDSEQNADLAVTLTEERLFSTSAKNDKIYVVFVIVIFWKGKIIESKYYLDWKKKYVSEEQKKNKPLEQNFYLFGKVIYKN